MANPQFAVEIPLKIKDNYPDILKKYWGNCISNPADFFCEAQKRAKEAGANYISLYLNIDDLSEKDTCAQVLKDISKIISMPFIVRGSSNKAFNEVLIPYISKYLPKDCIVAHAQDTNYVNVVRAVLGHKIVLRTPIDINLTKELNILSVDEGVNPKDILIDPDMGCVGYGLDYGFSIIERIKEAAKKGDKMLDMPIIVFTGEESYKAKETKSEDFKPSWGDIETRSLSWEIATTTSLLTAGADIAVVWNPETVKAVKKTWGNV